jgi:NTE family protein
MSISALNNDKNSSKNDNQQIHRVLIFQGGGALGAYEAGLFKALYDNLIELSLNENRQLFDIVAGTSAGAINSTLIVNHVLQNKNKFNPWKDSADMLIQFWEDVSTDTLHLENPFIRTWYEYLSFFRNQWNDVWKPIFNEFDKNYTDIREKSFLLPFYFLWPDRYGKLATYESFRRYWSWYQFSISPFGTPNVLSSAIFQPDYRFLNPFNFMIRYDNNPLTKTICKYWDDKVNPIRTDEGEPRLLLVAVDMQDATTITFDSYCKKDNQMMSVYGDNERKEKHIIRYKDGIKMEHLLTTMSSHLRYKFPQLDVTTTTIDENEYLQEAKRQPRPFMDGFYLSNTPLREVLQAHRDYWYKVKGLNENVPSLDIYIGNLYTAKEKGIPEDPDSINNRVQNILYHDKSKYDEKVAAMISDYIYIIRDLIKIANEKGISEIDIYNKLNTDLKNKIKSTNRRGKTRHIKDLINGRAIINHIQRIEYGEGQHLSDSNDIHGKAFDFSKQTIKDLIIQGYEDTCIKCKFK